MSLRTKIQTTVESPDGRVKLLALSLVGVLAALLLLGLAVVPAGAGAGGASGAGIAPDEHALGGESGDCSVVQGDLPSAGQYEYRIVNPQNGTYTGPGNVTFTLKVYNNEKLDFTVSGGSVFDVVIKGGQNSTHFDYDANGGPRTADTGLHAPTKGNSNNLYALSHTTFCYSKTVTIGGTVYNDAEADGAIAGAAGVSGVSVHLFNGSTHFTTTTGTNGSYSFVVPAGTYTVCEALPDRWYQSFPSTGTDCTAHTDGGTVSPGPKGYSVAATTGGATYGGKDFGNFKTATVSGVKFNDANATGTKDAGENGLGGWVIRAFKTDGSAVPGPLANNATTAGDGTYSLTLVVGYNYIICEELATAPPGQEWAQVGLSGYSTYSPAADACIVVTGVAPDGHVLSNLQVDKSGIDFGNFLGTPLECGAGNPIFLAEGDETFTTAQFSIFSAAGVNCGDKVARFESAESAAGFLLAGNGTAVARGIFDKEFGSPPNFEPLEYSQVEGGTFYDLSWCDTRAKAGGDGTEFDEWLGGLLYPSLDGIFDAPGVPAISCKVAETEDASGHQTTVVYFEGVDPFYR